MFMGPFKCYIMNALGVGRVSYFPEKIFTRMYGSMLLALPGGGWVSDFQKKCYVTLEWPLYSSEPLQAAMHKAFLFLILTARSGGTCGSRTTMRDSGRSADRRLLSAGRRRRTRT